MRKKIAHQISVPVIAATVIAILIITFFSYVIINQVTQRQLDINISNAHRTYSKTLEVLMERTLQFAAILPDNDMVKKAYRSYYQSNDIEGSVEILKKEFKTVNMFAGQTEFSNLRIHYHTNTVQSFYRSWTEKRGDDLNSFRETIKKCQTGKKPIKGIEAGRGGMAIRGIVPILDTEGSVLGSVENYVKMEELIKRMIVDSTQENFALIIKPEITELFDSIVSEDISPQSRFVDGYLLYSVTSNLFELNEFNKSVFEKALLKKLSFKTKNYVNSLEPITDFEGKTIGLVVYQYNLFEYNRQLSELRYLFMGVSLTLFFFIFVIIKTLSIKIVGKPINTIKSFIQRISKGDLETDEQVCCVNEIGDVFENLMQMSRILKENREILVNKNAELLTAEKEIRASNEQLMVINKTLNEKMAQLKESAEFNRSLIQTIPYGIDVVDENGTILFLNEILINSVGKDALGKKCYTIYSDKKTQCKGCPLKRKIKVGETAIIESPELMNGRIFHISHTGMMFQGKKAVLEIFQDVTESTIAQEDIIIKNAKLQLAEEEIRIANEELISTNIDLHHRMEELKHAKERAEEADKLKTSFLHNISHEIRTPLNAIVGFTDLIANRDYPKEQTLEFTKIIQQGSEQLTSVITDIINIATIEADQLKKFEKRTDINTLISNLFPQFTLKVAEKEINLIYSQLNGVNPIIMADETKITQILSNLIGNAIKFTDKGTIDYGCQLIDGFLQFYVKDEGIGIPTDLHEKIFERFLQIKITVNREYGGNGLGLSIAKAYVELLGGKIWIKSEPGKGSIFYFTIPYTPLLF